ncbi:MAG: L-rhamnose mutarotase [Verrucomicrobiota bacterium JB024]|nr:L-rhamnose mutarotase [Verrucomicrobiota bacterium JB024]
MIRKGFMLSVYPGQEEEYTRRHNPIWPELREVLKAHGVAHYSIFLNRNRHLLFGYVEIESEARWEAIAQTGVCRRWWRYMSDIMPTNDDDSPVSESMEEVFGYCRL